MPNCRNRRSPRRWGPTRRLHSHAVLFEVPRVPSGLHRQHWPGASRSHHHVTPGPLSSKVPTQQSSWTLNGPWKSTKGNTIWLILTQFDFIWLFWLIFCLFDSLWLFDSLKLNFTHCDSLWINLTHSDDCDSIWLIVIQFD